MDDKGSRELICSVGQVAKTLAFHGGSMGSTPIPSTIGGANSISTIREQCTRLPLTKLRYKKDRYFGNVRFGECVFESHYLLQRGNCVSASLEVFGYHGLIREYAYVGRYYKVEAEHIL